MDEAGAMLTRAYSWAAGAIGSVDMLSIKYFLAIQLQIGVVEPLLTGDPTLWVSSL